MSTIVTRIAKGTSLTWEEMDANFTNLNTDKVDAATIIAATDKATPVDADSFPIVNSVDNLFNKVTWANIKATLKTYFDSLYTTSASVVSYVNGLINITIMGFVTPGTSGNLLTSNGSAWTSAAGTSAASQAEVDAGTVSTKYIPPSLRKISLLATQATTSGTTKDFTIPAGARQITVMFNGVSTNNTSPFLIQIGDAGGIENTGYLAMCDLAGGSIAGVTSTVGFIVVRAAVAASLYQGKAVLDLVDPATFTWLSSSLITDNSTGVHVAAGSKALSAELTTVRVTSGTPDTFDAGLVGVSYIL